MYCFLDLKMVANCANRMIICVSSGCGHMLCENSFVGSKKQQTRFMGVKGLKRIYTEDETQQHIH